MATNPNSPITDFSKDVLGRYICNGWDEARRSADPTVIRPDGRPQIEARPFDLIIIGGGTFGAVVAEHMAFRDRSRACWSSKAAPCCCLSTSRISRCSASAWPMRPAFRSPVPGGFPQNSDQADLIS
jgi:hypothetical protein